jgi:hypothetical protein
MTRTAEAMARNNAHNAARRATMVLRNQLDNPARRPEVRVKMSVNNGMHRPEIRARCSAAVARPDVRAKKMLGNGGFLRGQSPPGFRARLLISRVYRLPEDAARCQYEKRLWARYRTTPEDIARAYERQQLACGICGIRVQLDGQDCVIDHCHASGRFRGLLHRACNLALGHLEAVDPKLARAQIYLREHA